MHLWEQILLVVGMLGVGFWIYTLIKHNPGLFSKENLGKSFYTMGILAIVLIAFIAMCIWILRLN